MSRVEGTDLFWYETTLPPDARWAGWRNRTDRVFEALFPAPPAEGAKAARP